MAKPIGERLHLEGLLRTVLAAASLPLLGAACAARLVSEDLARGLFVRWCRLALRALGLQLEIEHENGDGWPAEPSVFVLLNQASLIEALDTKEGHWRLTDEAAKVLLQGPVCDTAGPGQRFDCPVASRVAPQQVDRLFHIARRQSSGHG